MQAKITPSFAFVHDEGEEEDKDDDNDKDGDDHEEEDGEEDMEESSLTTACPRPFGPLFCLL
jgi:hypothetical protein